MALLPLLHANIVFQPPVSVSCLTLKIGIFLTASPENSNLNDRLEFSLSYASSPIRHESDQIAQSGLCVFLIL